jgi:ATP-dependent helicase HrpA
LRIPDSDFLTLLNIWDAYHDEFETMAQAKLRRFCRDHFLSYTRMREWRDVHTQLRGWCRRAGEKKLSSALHGMKDEDRRPRPLARRPTGRSTGDPQRVARQHRAPRRAERRLQGDARPARDAVSRVGAVSARGAEAQGRRSFAKAGGRGPPGVRTPRWIMASEIMETTRLYARTCARLDPLWALELGAHLVRVTHSEPFWDAEKGA